MDNQMMNMEELEQVVGGNILTDAWDWLCEKAKETVSDPFGAKKYEHPVLPPLPTDDPYRPDYLVPQLPIAPEYLVARR